MCKRARDKMLFNVELFEDDSSRHIWRPSCFIHQRERFPFKKNFSLSHSFMTIICSTRTDTAVDKQKHIEILFLVKFATGSSVGARDSSLFFHIVLIFGIQKSHRSITHESFMGKFESFDDGFHMESVTISIEARSGKLFLILLKLMLRFLVFLKTLQMFERSMKKQNKIVSRQAMTIFELFFCFESYLDEIMFSIQNNFIIMSKTLSKS